MPTSLLPKDHKRPAWRTSCWLILVLLVLTETPARAQPPVEPGQRLALEVRLNGRPTGLIVVFVTATEGRFLTSPQELSELGIDTTALSSATNGLVSIADLPGGAFSYDEASQTIEIRCSPSALRMTRVRSRDPGEAAELTPSSTGAVLNYAFLASSVLHGAGGPRVTGGGGIVDGRVFGAFGMVSGAVAVTARSGRPISAVRLDTTWSFQDPVRLTAYNAGDVITRGFNWTRPVRLGGLQFTRSFELRPDLITQPLPVLRGTAQAPSSLDLFVDGAQTSSSQIPEGPFEVVAPPPATGASVTQVRIRDVLGRESIIDLPFYASDTMLAPRLFDFAVELGFVRRNYGSISADYDRNLAASGSIRYGVSRHLTLQAHAEGNATLANFGVGGVATVRNLVLVSAAVVGSDGPRGSGALFDVGVQSRHGPFSASVRLVRTWGNYDDLASVTARPGLNFEEMSIAAVPSRMDQAQLTTRLWSRYALLGASYARVARAGEDIRIGSLSITQSVHGLTAYVRGSQEFGSRRSRSFSIGLSFSFGSHSGSSEASIRRGEVSAVTELATRPPIDPGDIGFRARVTAGKSTDRLAAVNAMTGFGQFEVGVQQTPGLIGGFFQAAGGFAVAGGRMFASRRMDGPFAVVDVGVRGVPVSYENRPMGVTDRRGVLLVPGLSPWQRNRLSIDTRYLPVDRDLSEDALTVAPRAGAAVVARLVPSSGGASALVRFVDSSGTFIPVGSSGSVHGGSAFVVGYDGEAFIEGLAVDDEAVIDAPDGRRCSARFTFHATPGRQSRLGPIVCRPVVAEAA